MAKTYTQEQINNMTTAQRSAAWHGADKATQDALHAANERDLRATKTYNSTTGVWSDKGGGASAPKATPTPAPYSGGAPTAAPANFQGSAVGDFYGAFLDGVKNGADYDTLSGYLNGRLAKTAPGQGFEQYAGDAAEQHMRDYLATMKQSNSSAQQLIESLKAQLANRPEYPDMQDFSAAMGYDANRQAIQDAIKASVDQAITGYQKQITDTEKSAEEAARQAYIAKKLGERNLDQQLAAGGYAGGAADSQRIAQETNYQNQIAQMTRMKEETVAELERAITAAKLSGNLQEAQQLQALMQQLQSQWQSYVSDWTAQNNQNAQLLAQLGLQQEQTQYDRQQSERADAYNRAMTSIAQGIMPSEAELSAAGITPDTARGYLGGVRAPGAPIGDGTPRGPGYDNGGLTGEQIRAMQGYYGLTQDGYWGANSKGSTGMSAQQAWEKYQQFMNGSGHSAYYGNALRQLNALASAGNTESFVAALEQMIDSGKLNNADVQSLKAQYREMFE